MVDVFDGTFITNGSFIVLAHDCTTQLHNHTILHQSHFLFPPVKFEYELGFCLGIDDIRRKASELSEVNIYFYVNGTNRIQTGIFEKFHLCLYSHRYFV